MNRYGFSRRQFGRGVLGAGLLGLQCLAYFDDDDDPTGAGGSAPPPPAANAADTLTRYGGDAVRMAERVAQLERDNYNVRESRRQDRQKLADLQKQVAPEGAVILTGDDAKAWETYKALGAPEEVSKTLEDGKAALASLGSLTREQTLAEAAKEANLKPGLLKILAKDLDVQLKEIDVASEDGKTTTKAKRPFVVTKNGEAVVEKPLRDYFKEQGEDVLASLDAGEGDYSQQPEPGATDGVKFPTQGGGTQPQKTNFASLSQGRYAHNAPKAEAAK